MCPPVQRSWPKRTSEVLVDRNAITCGAAANGAPWRYYDLGHGWCSYEFFDQCPHRMACVRCDFYVPKDSTYGQWLETRDGLLKMLQEIPLSDDECAAVDGDVQALNRLLEYLKEVPTPDECSQENHRSSLKKFIPVSNVSLPQKSLPTTQAKA